LKGKDEIVKKEGASGQQAAAVLLGCGGGGKSLAGKKPPYLCCRQKQALKILVQLKYLSLSLVLPAWEESLTFHKV